MEWTRDRDSGRYTLMMGTCTATVWNSGRHGYAAKVTYATIGTAQYGFETVENAQAWCLTKLVELRVSGKSGSVSQPAEDD